MNKTLVNTAQLFFNRFFPFGISGFLFSFLLLFFFGCSKSNQTPPLTAGYNIYMAGTTKGKAVYWKNGAPVTLSDSGSANAIAVNGSEVIVCGMINQNNQNLATYWLNGKQTILESQAGSQATGIAIQGGDVYFSGFIVGPDSLASAVYWKNGVLHYLSPGSAGSATGIRVSGQEVYLSGITYGNTGDSAIVWKNDEKYFFGAIGTMSTVGFNGSDTFYLGTLNAAPTYWTQNKTTKLYFDGFVDALAFAGADVYMGGGVRPDLNYNYAAFWKNDTMTILTEQYTNSAVLGIAVAGTDTYAVGYVNDEFNDFSPVYWKNGIMTKLGSNGKVNSISLGQ